ncbi:MAG: ester cyclase [Candidatus Krumholzibacteriota bacterium]
MIIRMAFLLAAFSILLTGISSAGTPSENKALVENFVKTNNERDYDRLAEFVTDDFTRHAQASPSVVVTNREQFREVVGSDTEMFPDAKTEIQQILAEGDRVAMWATYSGTPKTSVESAPSSGKKMVLELGAFFRIENDKIAEMWVTWDNAAVSRQLN